MEIYLAEVGTAHYAPCLQAEQRCLPLGYQDIRFHPGALSELGKIRGGSEHLGCESESLISEIRGDQVGHSSSLALWFPSTQRGWLTEHGGGERPHRRECPSGGSVTLLRLV